MGAYDHNFALASDETFIPRPERVRALLRLLPAEPFTIAPRADDRAAWAPWADTPFGRRMLAEAREINAAPFPDYNNATWLHSLEQRTTERINPIHKQVRRRLSTFLLAETIFDTGEFIDGLVINAVKLSELNTWTHPNNDLARRNYDGLTQEPDLHTLHFSELLALTDFILGDRLPAATRTLVRTELNRRLFAPLRERIETGRDLYWWIAVKHNWNSVCLSLVVHTAFALLPEAEERAWWLAFAQAQVINFRDSFTDDGFCTEGVSYWSYGFMHYVLMSELLRTATAGSVDLLDESKMARAARFATRTEIQPGVFPTFADCALDVNPYPWLRYWPDNRQGTPPLPVEPSELDPLGGLTNYMATEALLWMFRSRDPYHPVRAAVAPALRDWFSEAALLICRPGADTRRRFSATLLGGNNGVNHNHNDLGSFTVVVDGRTLILDPGMEIYSYRTFSAQRYESKLLNSFGHPVPRVAGQLQEAGAQYRARILASEFTETKDRMVLDLREAYAVPTLVRLEREFVYDRSGDGSLTITDRFEFTAPAEFETALITLGTATRHGNKLHLIQEASALTVEASAESAELDFSEVTIDQTPHPRRIGIGCRGLMQAGSITLVIRPA